MSDRVIKFRAKQSEGRGWFFGAYIPPEYASYNVGTIYNGYMRVEIDQDTLGQFTGYKDAEGQDIYEGDILEVNSRFVGEIIMVVGFGEISGTYAKEKYLGFYVDMRQKNAPRHVLRKSLLGIFEESVKVAGNIFDNPELLGGDTK